MNDNLSQLARRRDIKFGATQLDILKKQIGDGGAAHWTPGASLTGAEVVVLDDAPSGIGIDLFLRALPPEATVVIPFGENPQFDTIKGHLHCHGTIGASGVNAPHLVWWGGRTPARAGNAGELLRNAHVVSCVRRHTHEERDALAFCKALASLGVTYAFDISDAHVYRDDCSRMRSECLLRAWSAQDMPLIWLDPIGNVDLSKIEPALDGADFAAIFEPEHGFSTAMLYFGRSPAAHDLLVHWNKLCAEFPYLPASFVLDTAWAMISAQRPLITRWLSAQSCEPMLAQARAQALAPSLVVQEQIDCRSAGFKRSRYAARPGAPEPQSITKARFTGGAPLIFLTSADDYPARDVATLVEDVLTAFDHDSADFCSLAAVVCRDMREMAEAINASGNVWILHARPGTPIDKTLFSQLATAEVSDHVVYFGSEAREKARTATGQSIVLTRSTIVFGRARNFMNSAVRVANRQLRLIG